MNSTVIPVLRYRDAELAIDWLCRAFGFEVFLKVPGDGTRIEHARLVLETNMVMLASIGRDGAFEDQFKLPEAVGGVTQGLILRVLNPDRTYNSAVAAGAKIVNNLADSPFGGRMFSCLDLESHAWVFGNHDHWEKNW